MLRLRLLDLTYATLLALSDHSERLRNRVWAKRCQIRRSLLSKASSVSSRSH